MMKNRLTRRDLVKALPPVAAGSILVGCGVQEKSSTLSEQLDPDYVTMYDTYAQALYFDGGLGPKTGIIRVDYILEDIERDFDFWHGHGGKLHRYTLTRDDIGKLKKLERVYLTTSEVDRHAHRLFIDPTDARWRVPGAQPVRVPKAV